MKMNGRTHFRTPHQLFFKGFVAGRKSEYICKTSLDFRPVRMELKKVNYTNIMQPSDVHNKRMATMTFASVYPLYVTKIEKKGRTIAELNQVIEWLTGFDEIRQQKLIEQKVDFASFFAQAKLHANAHLITGMICGYRIEEIENELTRNVRYLDKLVDELAKGRVMEKILRS